MNLVQAGGDKGTDAFGGAGGFAGEAGAGGSEFLVQDR